jgi:CubicO group peptidase (beta-lactamase class C family)
VVALAGASMVAALQPHLGGEIMGAVTATVTVSGAAAVECCGFADAASGRHMAPDTLFRIASMSKPVTGAAVLMLQDEGLLELTDAVSTYIPEMQALRTPSGEPANVTLLQMLTHTSGMGEGAHPPSATTLAELVPGWAAAGMQFAPGDRWAYCQSGINACGRVVEVVSGQPFEQFLQERIFSPLGMTSTTFYPSSQSQLLGRLATVYNRSESGLLKPVPELSAAARGEPTPPLGNGGLFSTAPDYARFAQMLLCGGTLGGVCYLSAAAIASMSTPATPEGMECGFMPGFGLNYGWGAACCVLRAPHAGPGEFLLPGSFGHGGAWGTQCWIDPLRGAAYLLFVQVRPLYLNPASLRQCGYFK